MVSTFYSSNEKKQKDYIKNRYLQEQNDDEQQNRVDRSIKKNLDLEEQATELSKLATRVVNKLGSELPQLGYSEKKQLTYSPIKLLTNSINNGQLTTLFDELKALPDSSLNKTQLLIRNDLNDPENKKMINFLIEDAIPNGADAIAKTVVESLGGVGNEQLVLDMISKVEMKKLRGRPVESLDTKKERRERKLKGKQDINILTKREINQKKEKTLMSKEDYNILTKSEKDRYLMSKEDINVAKKRPGRPRKKN